MFNWIGRHRNLFLLSWTLAALAASIWTDPDSGFATFLGGLAIAQGVWAIAAAHLGRKALADYPEADQRRLFAKAIEHPVGAGLALIALAIVFVGLLIVFAPRAKAAELPDGFLKYGHLLKVEQQHYWTAHYEPWLLAALVEQENCISLRSKGCWNPATRLKTSREEGAGMGQITRVYRKDGSLRFDALASLHGQYGDALGDLSWGNVYTRPELQFRALVLMSKDAVKPFRAAPDMLKFGDAAYNGGPADIQKSRRACALTKRCDPGLWFGHVELHCMKSRQPIYGGRNACDINLEHVHNVFLVRPEKYRKAWATL